MSKEKPALAWKKADFEKAGMEVPQKLLDDNLHSEGELLSEIELAEWLKDTTATFLIIKEKDAGRFEELYRGYLLDIQYLLKIGKITDEEAEELTKTERFDF